MLDDIFFDSCVFWLLLLPDLDSGCLPDSQLIIFIVLLTGEDNNKQKNV